MWTFLMGLSGILRVSEKKDGIVLHEEVLALVKAEEGVICLWQEVVGRYLTEKESEFLLQEICHLFTNAWGRGVAFRHGNAIKDRPKHMVALRAGLEENQSNYLSSVPLCFF